MADGADGANGIRAGRAYVELGVYDKLSAGLRMAAAKLKAFGAGVASMGTKLAGIGMAVGAPMIGAVASFTKTGSALWDMSKRTGVSVESLQMLGYAVQQSGGDMESLEGGLKKMQKLLGEAFSGSKSAQEDLASLGLTIDMLNGLLPQEQFAMLAEQINKIDDPTLRAAAAMKIFGKNGTGLLPAMEGGAEGLRAFYREARKLGIVMSTEDAKAADDFGDAVGALWRVLNSAYDTIGAALVPQLRGMVKCITNASVMTKAWLSDNREIVGIVAQVVLGVVAAGIALVILGKAISLVGMALSGLATVVAVVSAVLKILGAVIAFMVTPVGMVIAAVVALGGYIIYATGAGGKALGWMGERFNELRDEAVTAWGGIADALATGDLGLAARIAWLTVKMWFQKGVNWISGIWNDCVGWLTQRWYESIGGWRIIFEEIAHGIMVAWIATTAFLAECWNNFVYGLQVAWNWCGKVLQKAWNSIRGVFDKSFDSDAANKAVEQAYHENVSTINNEKDAKLKNVDEEYNRQMQFEKNLNQQTLQRIIDETEAKKEADQKDRDDKVRNGQMELDDAKKKWQDSIDLAKKNREEQGANGPEKMAGPEDLTAKIKDMMKGVDVGGMDKSFSSRGTFNAMAVQSLQTSPTLDRVAKATEQTAKGIDGLRRDVRNNISEYT